ncbi:MAG: hypothetical protein ACM30H_13345 [Clostridia bacterium]
MASRVLMLLLLAAFLVPASAAGQAPGFGVVQSITRLPAAAPEESASSGASSAPSKAKRKALYLVRVKMDDGSYQVREVARRPARIGQRVLVTNAGDVLPE